MNEVNCGMQLGGKEKRPALAEMVREGGTSAETCQVGRTEENLFGEGRNL